MGRCGLRTVRQRTLGSGLQPDHRNLRSGGHGFDSVWHQGCGSSLQPIHWSLWCDPPGLERLWVMGTVGVQQEWRDGLHPARQQRVWHGCERADLQRREGWGCQHGPWHHSGRQDVQRRHVRHARWQRIQEHRLRLAEIRRRQLEQRAEADHNLGAELRSTAPGWGKRIQAERQFWLWRCRSGGPESPERRTAKPALLAGPALLGQRLERRPFWWWRRSLGRRWRPLRWWRRRRWLQALTRSPTGT